MQKRKLKIPALKLELVHNPSLDEEINPYIWNITASGWSEKIRNMLVDDIKNFLEKNYR